MLILIKTKQSCTTQNSKHCAVQTLFAFTCPVKKIKPVILASHHGPAAQNDKCNQWKQYRIWYAFLLQVNKQFNDTLTLAFYEILLNDHARQNTRAISVLIPIFNLIFFSRSTLLFIVVYIVGSPYYWHLTNQTINQKQSK